MNIHIVRNLLNATFSKSQQSHYERTWCINFSTPWVKYSWLKSLGLKSSWLKCLRLKGLGLKLRVEKSGVEMFFNHLFLIFGIDWFIYSLIWIFYGMFMSYLMPILRDEHCWRVSMTQFFLFENENFAILSFAIIKEITLVLPIVCHHEKSFVFLSATCIR